MKYQLESMKVSIVSVSRRAGREQRGQGTLAKLRCRARGGFTCRLEIGVFRQEYGQVAFRHRHNIALVAVDNRYWASPVALPGYQPVTEPICDPAFSPSPSLNILGDRPLSLLAGQTVELSRVDHDTWPYVSLRERARIPSRAGRLPP